MSMDDETRAEIDEAGQRGIRAEALSNVLTTSLTALMFVEDHFAEWRAWCDEHGWTSGPKDAKVITATAFMLNEVLGDG